jgi:tetratricopeptide (TPR) repeat protein
MPPVPEFGISIDAAYTLARLLVRSSGPLDRFQGRQILLQASQLGSAKATLYAVKTATKTRQLDKQDIQPVLDQLQKLATQKATVVPALVAQARIHEENGEFPAAEALYTKAINAVPEARPSVIARLGKRIKERFNLEDAEAVVKKKITVDDMDTELDVVAAHLGLAQLQYHRLSDHGEAIKNWEIAALEYDDPVAYFNLATHLETIAKLHNEDKSDDHHWLLYVPYKWYEYMMKAAASGHAEACYKIGMFYMLGYKGHTQQIADYRLQTALASNPLMTASPGIFRASSKYNTELNQVDTIQRWLRCAEEGGHAEAHILLQDLIDQKSPN